MLSSLPPPWRQRLHRLIRPAWLGTLRRTAPLSRRWGYDRGNPVDRYYIERFLDQHRADIRGRVLEVKDNAYTKRFGSSVDRSDVLDIDATNSSATIIADLAAADGIPAERFDCFILTQTLQLIYDARAAVAHARRILKPGGVLLATVPSVSPIVPGPGLDYDHWRFTSLACKRLFSETFGPERVTVRPVGNVLTCVAFLEGMAYEELSRGELDTHDPYYPLLITIRALK